MADEPSLAQRASNRFFGIPAVAQMWARLSAGRTGDLVDLSGAIPFAPFDKPLSAAKGALLTTGGIHLPDQPPFDMQNPDGDATFRAIPGDIDTSQLVITHKYYDHTDADADPNVIFPLDQFRDLVDLGVVGSMGPRHFGFMGHIDGRHIATLIGRTARQVVEKLRQDKVDVVLLTPA